MYVCVCVAVYGLMDGLTDYLNDVWMVIAPMDDRVTRRISGMMDRNHSLHIVQLLPGLSDSSAPALD